MTWDKMSREQKVDYIIQNNLDHQMNLDDIRSYCERNAFVKGIKDPIFGRSLSYKFTLTRRWVLALYTLGWLQKYTNLKYIHYRRDLMPQVNKIFNTKIDITNLPLISRDPYGFIAPMVKTNIPGECDGMWRLTTKGKLFIMGKIEVPKSCQYSTVGSLFLPSEEMIDVYNVPDFDFKNTVKILKSY